MTFVLVLATKKKKGKKSIQQNWLVAQSIQILPLDMNAFDPAVMFNSYFPFCNSANNHTTCLNFNTYRL